MWHVGSRSGVATLRTAMHLLLSLHAAHSVVCAYVRVLGAPVSPAKTAEPIDMPFGWQSRVAQGTMHQREGCTLAPLGEYD